VLRAKCYYNIRYSSNINTSYVTLTALHHLWSTSLPLIFADQTSLALVAFYLAFVSTSHLLKMACPGHHKLFLNISCKQSYNCWNMQWMICIIAFLSCSLYQSRNGFSKHVVSKRNFCKPNFTFLVVSMNSGKYWIWLIWWTMKNILYVRAHKAL